MRPTGNHATFKHRFDLKSMPFRIMFYGRTNKNNYTFTFFKESNITEPWHPKTGAYPQDSNSFTVLWKKISLTDQYVNELSGSALNDLRSSIKGDTVKRKEKVT